MRSDMKKLLCEEGRHPGNVRKGKAYRSYDDMPFREGMSMTSRRNGYSGKNFGEHLKPLERYIQKQVGRSWDKVYSEIKESLGSGQTPVESHIFVHLEGYIAVKVVKADLSESDTGLVAHRVLDSTPNGYRWRVRPGQLFVCPSSGIIKRAKSIKPKTPKPKPENNYRDLGDDQVAGKLKGIWYIWDKTKAVESRNWSWNSTVDKCDRLPENIGNSDFGWYSNGFKINGVFCHWLPESEIPFPRWSRTREQRLDVYINKRQMSNLELRKYNLRND